MPRRRRISSTSLRSSSAAAGVPRLACFATLPVPVPSWGRPPAATAPCALSGTALASLALRPPDSSGIPPAASSRATPAPGPALGRRRRLPGGYQSVRRCAAVRAGREGGRPVSRLDGPVLLLDVLAQDRDGCPAGRSGEVGPGPQPVRPPVMLRQLREL